MFLKRDILDHLQAEGINKFILIGENVLNFHYSDDSYYEELFDEVSESDGWVTMLNFRDHVQKEFDQISIDSYFLKGGSFDIFDWRTKRPATIFRSLDQYNKQLFLT